MFVLGVHPVEDAAASGRGVHAARDAAAKAEVDVEAALAWRDFMVSDYSDAGQERWLADNGIDLLRGTGRLPAQVWSRSTVCAIPPSTSSSRTAPIRSSPRSRPPRIGRHLVQPRGDIDEVRPAPTAHPGRRLVGVELAQAVRRLGGEAAIIDMADHVLAREPAPLGEALGEVLRREGIELVLSANATAARRDGEDYVLEFDDGREVPATSCSSPPGGDRASAGSGWKRLVSSQTRTAFRSTRTCARPRISGRSATSTASGR